MTERSDCTTEVIDAFQEGIQALTDAARTPELPLSEDETADIARETIARLRQLAQEYAVDEETMSELLLAAVTGFMVNAEELTLERNRFRLSLLRQLGSLAILQTEPEEASV